MIRTCTQCGQRNRVPPRHLADAGRCGACKAEIAPVSEPIDADTEFFDEVLREAKVPVLVDFWAAWCAPCRMAAPQVARVAADMSGRCLVLKVDTERHPQLAARYKVAGIPNFLVAHRGRVLGQRAGLVDHRELQRWLESSAAS